MCCECWEDEMEPTAEELADSRRLAEERLAARMTPAQTPSEQVDRDMADARKGMMRYMNGLLKTFYPGPKLGGLAAWLSGS